MQSNVNYSNGYTRLPIKIPETILEIVSGHLFESDFRPYFKLFLDDPLGYTLTHLLEISTKLTLHLISLALMRIFRHVYAIFRLHLDDSLMYLSADL